MKREIKVDTKNSSLSEDAYDRLKTAIMTYELRPGDSVSQSGLEKKYGIGKASIRSTLTRLEQEQLVRAVPRQGYIISPITIPEIENVFNLRLTLEPYGVKLATARIDQNTIKLLDELCQIQYLIDDKDSLNTFLMANRDFHMTITKASGNDILISFCKRLHDQSLRMLYLGITLENQSMSWQHGHGEIVKAIKDRDAKKAAEVLYREITDSKNLVLKAVIKSPALAQVNLVPK